MFFNIHNGYLRIPFHIMNATEVYEKCNSREPTTSVSQRGLCDCYNTTKRHRSDLARYAVASGQGKQKKCGPTIFAT